MMIMVVSIQSCCCRWNWIPANLFILNPYQEMLDEWEQKQWEGCVATAREWAGDDEQYKGLSDGEIVGCSVRSGSY